MIPLRTLWYRFYYEYFCRKAIFGPRIELRGKLKIKGPGKVVFGPDCLVDSGIWDETPTVIATHAKDAFVTIAGGTILRGTKIGCTKRVSIGKNCLIENASIIDADFHVVDVSKRRQEGFGAMGAVALGDRVYVGEEAMIMKGATLGDGVVLSPGTVIGGRNVPSQVLVRGFPARAFNLKRDQEESPFAMVSRSQEKIGSDRT